LAEELDNLPVRKDASGKVVPLGPDDRPIAPGVIRARGEAPHSLARVVKALLEGKPEAAPMEFDISNKLQRIGYSPIIPRGSVMVPLAADYIPTKEVVWSAYVRRPSPRT